MSEVANLIKTQVADSLNVSHLELVNESQNHAGYFEGKESHFKLTVVSDDFVGKRLLVRHQLVYAAVSDLLTSSGGTVHALALHTYAPSEWQAQDNAPASPDCAGANR